MSRLRIATALKTRKGRNYALAAVFETVEAPRSFYLRAPQNFDIFSALPPKPVPLFRKDGGIFLFFYWFWIGNSGEPNAR